MRTALTLAVLLVLASVVVAPGATAHHCFPDRGPFDPCHYQCDDLACEVIVILGDLWSKTICRGRC